MKDSIIEVVAMAMLFISLAFAYYAVFLFERDQVLYEIIDCMEGDLSEESFELCHSQLNDKRLADRAPPGETKYNNCITTQTN